MTRPGRYRCNHSHTKMSMAVEAAFKRIPPPTQISNDRVATPTPMTKMNLSSPKLLRLDHHSAIFGEFEPTD